MPDPEEIIDSARAEIQSAPSLEQASAVAAAYKTRDDLPPSQVGRIDAWLAVRTGEIAAAIGHMATSYNQDQNPGAILDLAEVFNHVGFPTAEKRNEMIGLLAWASNQWRQGGLPVNALRADFLTSKIVYGIQDSFPLLRLLAEKWHAMSGSLTYSDAELSAFALGNFDAPALRRYLGLIYSLAGEAELAVRVNDAFTVPLDEFSGDRSAPEGAVFGTDVEGQRGYFENPIFRRTNENFVDVLIDGGNYGRVADLGCGCGLTGELLRGRADYLVGVDINEPALQVAQEKVAYDDLQQRDMLAFLQDETATFDLITSCMAIEWFPGIDEFIRLVWDRLSPGGRLALVFVPCGEGPVRVTRARHSGLHWYCYQPDFVADFAERLGFRVAKRELHPYAYSIGCFMSLERPA
jgi:hypothetical protein